MFTVSAVQKLNEAGQPPLTPDELWQAMVHHVRTGDQRFVPPGHIFEVIEDGEGEILRRAILTDVAQRVEFIQRVSLHAERAILMSTIDAPLNVRLMTIEANESGEYCLRLMLTACAPDAAHNSREERQIAQVRQAAVEASVAKFVGAARAMVANGEIVSLAPVPPTSPVLVGG